MKAAATIMTAAFLAAHAAAQTHAPWPDDWNDWSDPVLWQTVGNMGNAGDRRFPDAKNHVDAYGSVNYEYRIGTFEVTAGQYTAFLNAVAATDSYGLYWTTMADPVKYRGCNIQRTGSRGSYRYSVAADWANRPVNWISWGDAARFANWLTNGQPTGPQGPATTEDGSYRLNGAVTDEALLAVTRKPPAQGGRYYIPTEDEWYKAAFYEPTKPGGAGYWTYPTRNDRPPGQNMEDLSGNNANWVTGSPVFPLDGDKHLTEVGEFQGSSGPYGTFDQGGNLWEWNEAVMFGVHRGLRGGSYDYYPIDGMRATNRDNSYPSLKNADFGFRLVDVQAAGVHPGDANRDGVVNMEDFGLLKLNYGATYGATWDMGDFNGDGQINLDDFGLLALHYGHSGDADSDRPATSVPEPAGLLLTAVAAAGLRKRRNAP